MADQNSHDFDPYYKWLGIPPELQPADNYRLLGLRLFEEDREVIAIAADRQMAHVKTFAAGKYSRESQALLDELARAKLCLLNTYKKATYDSSLLDEVTSIEEVASIDSNLRPAFTTTLPAAQSNENMPVAHQVLSPSPAESIEINVHGRQRRRKRPTRNLVAGWYLFTLSLAILGFVILQMSTCEIKKQSKAAVIQRQSKLNELRAKPQAVDAVDKGIILNKEAYVSVLPSADKRRFVVQLSIPSTTDTAISYALAGKYVSGKVIQRDGVVKIRQGETLAIPISITGMVIAKIELLRVMGQPTITLDPAKSTAFIDYSQRRSTSNEHQRREQPIENEPQIERKGWGEDFVLEDIHANPTTISNGRLFYHWQLKIKNNRNREITAHLFVQLFNKADKPISRIWSSQIILAPNETSELKGDLSIDHKLEDPSNYVSANVRRLP